jgi:hypothetical protein
MSMSEERAQPPPGPIGFADANLPAADGLTGLGLIMSLTGALCMVIALGMATIMMFTMMLAAGDLRGAGTVILIALTVIATSILRSWAHRAAGQRLLYDGPGTPRSAMHRYFGCAALQTVLVTLTLASQDVPGKILAVLFVMLAGWPVALAIALAAGRFNALLDEQTIPPGEDKGFEGAAILMVVLGLTGLLFGAVMAISVLEEVGPLISLAPFVGLSLIAIMVMMIVRSAFHVRAGLLGVRQVHRDRAVEVVARYSNAAVLSGAVICGLLFLMTVTASEGRMEGPTILLTLIAMIFLMWALTTWPTLIKRFFVERQFADLLVPGEAPHHRAPDRGLTTLGWFLFGQAVMTLSMGLPALLAGPLQYGARDPMSAMLTLAQAGSRGQWWSIGVAVLQLAAAWQLIRMRPNHKRLVTIWSVVAALVAVYIHYPMLQAMVRSRGYGQVDVEALLGNLSFMTVAIALIAPIATLILVNRKERGLPMAVLQR